MQRSKNTLYLPELTKHRAECVKRRAEAFCDAPEYVLGIEVRPLTPATFSMLVATGSAFLSSNNPREHDVRNYLWFHSPLYAHCGVQDWRERKRAALREFRRQLGPWWHWLPVKRLRVACVLRYVRVMAKAVAEIRQLIDEAFADSPPRSGRPSKQIATTEAFFIHEFATAYQWPPDRTRHTPLRQLIQLHRCIRASRGDDISDDGEDRILAEHMDRENAKLEAMRRN